MTSCVTTASFANGPFQHPNNIAASKNSLQVTGNFKDFSGTWKIKQCVSNPKDASDVIKIKNDETNFSLDDEELVIGGGIKTSTESSFEGGSFVHNIAIRWNEDKTQLISTTINLFKSLDPSESKSPETNIFEFVLSLEDNALHIKGNGIAADGTKVSDPKYFDCTYVKG
jgi:hypothetical protein